MLGQPQGSHCKSGCGLTPWYLKHENYYYYIIFFASHPISVVLNILGGADAWGVPLTSHFGVDLPPSSPSVSARVHTFINSFCAMAVFSGLHHGFAPSYCDDWGGRIFQAFSTVLFPCFRVFLPFYIVALIKCLLNWQIRLICIFTCAFLGGALRVQVPSNE